jgi:hypothetical protein
MPRTKSLSPGALCCNTPCLRAQRTHPNSGCMRSPARNPRSAPVPTCFSCSNTPICLPGCLHLANLVAMSVRRHPQTSRPCSISRFHSIICSVVGSGSPARALRGHVGLVGFLVYSFRVFCQEALAAAWECHRRETWSNRAIRRAMGSSWDVDQGHVVVRTLALEGGPRHGLTAWVQGGASARRHAMATTMLAIDAHGLANPKPTIGDSRGRALALMLSLLLANRLAINPKAKPPTRDPKFEPHRHPP